MTYPLRLQCCVCFRVSNGVRVQGPGRNKPLGGELFLAPAKHAVLRYIGPGGRVAIRERPTVIQARWEHVTHLCRNASANASVSSLRKWKFTMAPRFETVTVWVICTRLSNRLSLKHCRKLIKYQSNFIRVKLHGRNYVWCFAVVFEKLGNLGKATGFPCNLYL